MRIAVLGDWVPVALFGDANILPEMERLRDLTGETVILGAQSDLFAQYMHVAHARDPLHYAASPGAVRPLARSVIGRLLLSGLPDAEIDRLVRRINIAEPEHRVEFGALIEDIGAIRRQGFAFSPSSFAEGVGVVATLLPSAPFGRRFALGVAGPVERLEAGFESHLANLRAAVAKMDEPVA